MAFGDDVELGETDTPDPIALAHIFFYRVLKKVDKTSLIAPPKRSLSIGPSSRHPGVL
jgi:hypothetical protein